MRLNNKVAWITGGAQGIGLACACLFREEGAQVVIADRDGVRVQEAARVHGLVAVEADVSQASGAQAAFDAVLAHFGRLDILVNNAGITHAADFLDVAEEDFDRVLGVNLKSYFLCGQLAARRMVEQAEGGAIINMSSANAVVAIANQVPYVVSKGAVNQLTKVMAINLAPHNIRVNGIGPGTIATDLAKQAVLGNAAAEQKILSRTPLGRLGEPEEVARVALFLASDDASYLTGQTIYPDGGRLALNYTMPPAPP